MAFKPPPGILASLIVSGTATISSAIITTLVVTGLATFNQNVTAPSFTPTSTSGGGIRFLTNGDVDYGTPALSGGNIYSSGTSSFLRGLNFLNATGTNATTTSLGVTGQIITTQILDPNNNWSISTSGQFNCNSGGTCYNTNGSFRGGGGGLGTALVATYNFTGDPLSGGVYDFATDRAGIKNSLVVNLISGGSAATSTINTPYFKRGEANTSTVMYIGTADGCGRWTFAASNTTPTLTPVNVTNCQ